MLFKKWRPGAGLDIDVPNALCFWALCFWADMTMLDDLNDALQDIRTSNCRKSVPHCCGASCAGVCQMDLGIILSWFNQRYFRDSLSTMFEFIPQMIFLNFLFGYLCLLIVGKWISGSTADLYHILIYMFLSPGDVRSYSPSWPIMPCKMLCMPTLCRSRRRG